MTAICRQGVLLIRGEAAPSYSRMVSTMSVESRLISREPICVPRDGFATGGGRDGRGARLSGSHGVPILARG